MISLSNLGRIIITTIISLFRKYRMARKQITPWSNPPNMTNARSGECQIRRCSNLFCKSNTHIYVKPKNTNSDAGLLVLFPFDWCVFISCQPKTKDSC